MFQTPHQAPLRGSATPDKPFGFHDATVDGGWEVPGEPYVNASEDDAGQLRLVAPAHAGRPHESLGTHSFRNGPYDFKPRTRDGLGFDWPIGYEELAPYYDKVEMLIGVYGANDGLENTPNSLAGLPAAAAEAARQRAADRSSARSARASRSSPAIAPC